MVRCLLGGWMVDQQSDGWGHDFVATVAQPLIQPARWAAPTLAGAGPVATSRSEGWGEGVQRMLFMLRCLETAPLCGSTFICLVFAPGGRTPAEGDVLPCCKCCSCWLGGCLVGRWCWRSCLWMLREQNWISCALEQTWCNSHGMVTAIPTTGLPPK